MSQFWSRLGIDIECLGLGTESLRSRRGLSLATKGLGAIPG